VRAILPPDGFWFAPLSPETGEIDTNRVSIGKHRSDLARKNIEAWFKNAGLPYHSPHKYRHGHIQYGQANAETIADYKAISLNVGHASMEITDQFYSNIKDREVQNRIRKLGKRTHSTDQDELELIKEFLEWKRNQKDKV